MKDTESTKIDFVIAWVDISDELLLKEKNKYNTNELDGKRTTNNYQ